MCTGCSQYLTSEFTFSCSLAVEFCIQTKSDYDESEIFSVVSEETCHYCVGLVSRVFSSRFYS